MSKVYSRQAKRQMKSVSFLQPIPTKHWFRNDLSLSITKAQPCSIPCGVVLGATHFDSFRCQQNYWCWLAMLTDGTWGHSAGKEIVVLKATVALGTSAIGGNHRMKEVVWKGNWWWWCPGRWREVCVWNRLWDLAASMWSREGAVMCLGCLSPHTVWWVSSQFLLALLLSHSGTSSFALLCHWSWLWTQWRNVTSLGCKMEIGEH